MNHVLAQFAEPQEFLRGVWICLGAACLVVIGPVIALLVLQLRELRQRRANDQDDRRGFDVTPPKDLP
jgi:hypothetical protein